MKKTISLIMCALLFVSCFTACGPESPETLGKNGEPITITIVCPADLIDRSKDMNDLYQLIHNKSNVTLEFEYLPDDYNNGYVEYNSMISRLRTEIMAGKGPDVFILPTWNTRKNYDDIGNTIERKEPLFPDVQDAMRNRIFLDLDEYLAESTIINMDDHRSIVMDAGKLGDNQMVMPLLFEFEIDLLDRNYIENPDFTYTDYASYLAAAEPDVLASMEGGYRWFHQVLTDYVDYDTEKLIITPDELAVDLELAWNTICKESNTWGIEYRPGSLYFIPLDDYFFYAWKSSEGQAVPVYIPNVEGGITATINTYAAVNANTEHPEEAFDILEMLFCQNIQTGLGFYSEELGNDQFGGWRPDSMFSIGTNGMVTHKETYTDVVLHNTEEIEELLSKINCVRFTSASDCMIVDTVAGFFDIFYDPYKTKKPDFDALAQQLCKDIEMRLAE